MLNTLIFEYVNLDDFHFKIFMFSQQEDTNPKVMDDHNADEQYNSDKVLQVNIRQHPLFFGVTLGLLAEIITSRYITFIVCFYIMNIYYWLKLR